MATESKQTAETGEKIEKTSSHRSYSATKEDAAASRAWWVVDATDKPLGRIASEVARILRGKHKPTYTPHVDTGDFVIVVNAGKVKLTGNKLDKKFYYRHSGIPGGFRAEAYRLLLDRKPTFPMEKAVKGMLPKNVLGREMFTKLKVYADADHPHAAQKPQPLAIK
ncbi:MAG: 50S ribosomal protein L13 [Polyangiaceae bacterium]|jgi:large subunit ribosomal protein L13|nr:50S ribosomal protein L13 [Polyangiaceae bacterium]